jgi:hypothetical protein
MRRLKNLPPLNLAANSGVEKRENFKKTVTPAYAGVQ